MLARKGLALHVYARAKCSLRPFFYTSWHVPASVVLHLGLHKPYTISMSCMVLMAADAGHSRTGTDAPHSHYKLN